jgi:hypothetical protein
MNSLDEEEYYKRQMARADATLPYIVILAIILAVGMFLQWIF